MPSLDYRRLMRAAFGEDRPDKFTTAEQLVRVMLADSRSSADRERREWSRRLAAAYRGDNLDDLMHYLAKIFEKPEEKAPITTSLVRKFSFAKSKVFNQSPNFAVLVNDEVNEEQTELFHSIYESGRWFEALQLSGRMEKIVNTVHLLQRPVDGTVYLDPLTPDSTVVFQSVSQPWQAAAIAYKVSDLALFDTATPDAIVPEIWAFWSDEEHFLFVVDGATGALRNRLAPDDNEDMVNPYGRLPIVKVQDERPEAGEYWGPLAIDVWLAEMAISAGLMAVEQAVIEQGYTITYSSGFPESLFTDGRGPGSHYNVERLLQGEVSPTFGSLGLDAQMKQMVEAVDAIAQRVAIDRGIPKAELSITQTAESGFSKLVDLAPQLEEREGDINRWTVYLKESFELLKLTWPQVIDPLFPGTFSEDAELFVSFSEPKAMETPTERLERIEKQIGLGLMSRVDAMMEVDPDLDREQAERRLEQIDLDKSTANAGSALLRSALQPMPAVDEDEEEEELEEEDLDEEEL